MLIAECSLCECLLKIGNQVSYIFNSHAQAHEVSREAGFFPQLRWNAGMRHEVGQADGGIHAPEAHGDRKYLCVLRHLPRKLNVAGLESDKRPSAARLSFMGLSLLQRSKTRIENAFHLRMPLQKIHN